MEHVALRETDHSFMRDVVGTFGGTLEPGGGNMAEWQMEGSLKEGQQECQDSKPCVQEGTFQARTAVGSQSPSPSIRAGSFILRRGQLSNFNRSLSRSSRRSGNWAAGMDPARLSVSSTRRKGIKEILRQSSQLRPSWLTASQRDNTSADVQDQENLMDVNSDDLSLALDPLEHEWMLTVAQGDAESILRLLAKDPSLLSRRDFVTGFTVLHWLAKHGRHEDLIQVITFAEDNCYPVDVNVLTASGRLTPLHLAALQGHEMVIKVLVGAYGANTSIRDHNGRKAWQYLRADASRKLKELSGACEEDLALIGACNNNNNNNCASSRFKAESRDERPSQSAAILGMSYFRSKLRQVFGFFQQW